MKCCARCFTSSGGKPRPNARRSGPDQLVGLLTFQKRGALLTVAHDGVDLGALSDDLPPLSQSPSSPSSSGQCVVSTLDDQAVLTIKGYRAVKEGGKEAAAAAAAAEPEEEEQYELAPSGCTQIFNKNGAAWAHSDGRDSHRRSTRSGKWVVYGGAVVTARISTAGKAPRKQLATAQPSECTAEAARHPTGPPLGAVGASAGDCDTEHESRHAARPPPHKRLKTPQQGQEAGGSGGCPPLA